GGNIGIYAPSGTTPGSGTFTVDGKSIKFSGLEPVTAGAFASISLVTPNPDDNLQLGTPSSAKSRISGTSGGVALESLTFYGTPTLILDTAANDGGAGNDSININSGGISAAGFTL